MEKVTLRRPEREGFGSTVIWGKNILGRGNSSSKGLGMAAGLTYLKNSKETNMIKTD